MANKFQINLVAVDRATAVIRKVNKSMNGMLRPMTNITRSTKALGNEVWANPIVKGVRRVGNAAWWAGSKVSSLISPMTALAGASSIAGIYSLADSWGRAGININYAAQRIGMSIGKLQGYRGAAVAAGLSADDMQNSLESLSVTLQDATQGRNQTAMYLLGTLGVKLKRNASGVIDTGKALDDIADALARTSNPATQATIASGLGLLPMLPILRQGHQALAKYIKLAKDMGAVDEEAAKANERLGESFSKLKLAWEGRENKISKGGLVRNLTYGNNALADWLSGQKSWMQIEKNYWGIKNKSRPANPAESGKITQGMPTFGIARIPDLRAYVHNQIAAGLKREGRSFGAYGSNPLGLRLNNPGNLRYAGQAGATRGARGFAQFGSRQAGMDALANQLTLYSNRDHLDTISGIIRKYAPPSENDTPTYIRQISSGMGVDPNQHLDINNPAVLSRLMTGITGKETSYMPSAEEIGQAVANALTRNPLSLNVHLDGPPGIRVTQKQASGHGNVATRVATSMHGTGA